MNDSQKDISERLIKEEAIDIKKEIITDELNYNN